MQLVYKPVVTLFFLVILNNFSYSQTISKSTSNSQTQVAQQSVDPDSYIRCYSLEMHQRRMQREGVTNYDENFENWLAPLMEERQRAIENGTFRRMEVRVPIIFHIITDGVGPTNLSAALVQAQIDQLNLDFNDQGGINGTSSSYSQSADAEIVFVPATIDPDGNPLAEPGINRVTQFGAGPFNTSQFDLGDGGLEIKPNTIWDRSQYANVWTADITGGILGYAQFPSNSTLPGLNTNGGSALNDGVVCGYGTIGSRTLPGSAPPYNLGRTLTHEIGHWIGLRHIWGDGGCSVDDFVSDTPNAGGPNYGCANPPSCGSADMVENYMDYTNDSCMDLFTAGQVSRIETVLANATGISQLPSSTTADAIPPTIFFPTKNFTVAEGSGCGFTDIDITLSLLPEGPTALAIANMSKDSGSAEEGVDFDIMTPNVNFQANTTGQQTLTLRIYGDDFVEADETFRISFSVNPNGGNAAAGVNNFVDVTITDDDSVPTASGNNILFQDNFESYNDFIIDNIGPWTFIDNDGDATYGIGNGVSYTNQFYTGSFMVFNPQSTSPAQGSNWDPFDGNKGLYCFNSTGNVSGVAENDDFAFTPQISNGTNGQISFQARSLTSNYVGGERFRVGVSTSNDGTGITYVTASPYVVPPTSWTAYNFNIPSAFDNQDIYVVFHVVSADEFVFMLDAVEITADFDSEVQTAVNTATSFSTKLNSSGTIYSVDDTSNNRMLDITNSSGFDYGCIDVAVTRSGNSAQLYNPPVVSAYVMDKSFTINTDNTTTSGANTILFYFTEDEISGWETATGNSRNSLVAYRENGDEIVSLTLNTLNNVITLSGLFTGLDGPFFFGTTNAFDNTLNVENPVLTEVKLFPNPSSSVVFIKGLEYNSVERAGLYSLSGQVVNTKLSVDMSFDISNLGTGIYFLSLQTEFGNKTFKLIKE